MNSIFLSKISLTSNSCVNHTRLVIPRYHYGLDFQKERLRGRRFLFRTVIKISKIKFTQFLHKSASKFFLRALPRYYMLQPMLNILFYIALLSSKILVLFGLDFRAGNSKYQRPKVPARSAPPMVQAKADTELTLPRQWTKFC